MSDRLQRVSSLLPFASPVAAVAGFSIIGSVDNAGLGWSLLGAMALGGPLLLLFVLTRFTLSAVDATPVPLSTMLIVLTVIVLGAVLIGFRFVFQEDPEVYAVLCIVGVVAFGIAALVGRRFPAAVVATGWALLLMYGAVLVLTAMGSEECWNCGEFSRAAAWTVVSVAAGGLVCVILAFMSLPGMARALYRAS